MSFQKTHGMRHTTEYSIWASMLNRCRNPRVRCFERYGGRGIRVCDRWLRFENFFADMGFRPTGMTLERKDTNGDYEPSNCKWATLTEQNNNKRTNRRITIDGETLTLAQWCRITGLHHKLIGRRLDRGWTPKQAVYIDPLPSGRPPKTYDRSQGI